MDEQILERIFFDDGSLRDIYVLDTDEDDWSKLLAWAREQYPLSFTVDGQVTSVPTDVAKIWEQKKHNSVTLGITVDEVLFNSHFFSKSEIELDIFPRGFTVQDGATVIGFVEKLAAVLAKRVCLTPENPQDAWNHAFVRISPTRGELEFLV